VSELEAAIADAGALIVRLAKYRRAAAPDAVAAIRDALAVGDAARRLHRRDTLGDAAAADLLARARALTDRLHALVRSARESASYRAAVAAHAAGDQRALARALPEVFVGLVPVNDVPELFTSVAWRRRGRPEPARDVAAAIVHLRDEGLPAEADDLAPGQDPDLPAIVLDAVRPPDELIVLRLPAGTTPHPVYRIEATGEHLVYARRLRTPFRVRVGHDLGDEQARVELDVAAYRADLAAALGAAAVPVDD